MRKVALVLTVLASALSLFMLTPAQADTLSSSGNSMPSSAADIAVVCVPAGCNIGYVSFSPNGDHVTVCDINSNDRSVRVSVWNQTKDPDVHEYYLTDDNGSNNGCVSKNADDGQPWNLAETHCFSFAAYETKDGEIVGSKNIVQLRNYNVDGPVECPGVD